MGSPALGIKQYGLIMFPLFVSLSAMTKETKKPPATDTAAQPTSRAAEKKKKPAEVGGPEGLEPTRYGDWERKGIVSDF